MTLVLDSGALIALDRGDRPMWIRFKAALTAETSPVTHGGVVGQAWRGGGARQARLAQALGGIEVRPLDEALGRNAGTLLGRSRRSDVVDGALVLLAKDGDRLVTSAPNDIGPLAAAAGRHIEIVRV